MRLIATFPITMCPIAKPAITIPAKVRTAKASSESRGPMRIGRADTHRAVTTPTCRVVAVAVVAAVLAEVMAISRRDPRSAGSAADIFNNKVSAADGRADGKWDHRSRVVRMSRAQMDKM